MVGDTRGKPVRGRDSRRLEASTGAASDAPTAAADVSRRGPEATYHDELLSTRVASV